MNMKTHIYLLLVITVLGLAAVPSRAGTDTDKDLSKKLSDFLTECEKITPGMTRTQLTNLFVVYSGGVMPLPDFEQHQSFFYRRCDLIKIDVDFSPSDSKDARPTDIIAKISKPYLAWSVAD
jgi:hypothetical protein